MRSVAAVTFALLTGVEGDHMRIQAIVPRPRIRSGGQTSLAAVEPHPSHPEIELLTFRCEDCGPVRIVSCGAAGGLRSEFAATSSTRAQLSAPS